MKIRTLQSSDYPQVLEMIRQLHALHVKGRPDLFLDTVQVLSQEEFQAHLPERDGLSVVAEGEGGTLLGVCLAQWRERGADPRWNGEKSAFITDLYVREACRREGIGRRLMDEVGSRAHRAGADCVELQVVSMPDGAFAFYQSIGFATKFYAMRCQLAKKGEGHNDTV